MGQISGMTGFGRSEGQLGDKSWVWETRSVNGKGLDARVRVPNGFERLEPLFRAQVKSKFVRGNVQASLNISTDRSEGVVRVDQERIKRLLAAAEPFIADGSVEKPSFDGLLGIRGVLEVDDSVSEDQQSALDDAILGSLGEALEALQESRLAEGRALEPILRGHVEEVSKLTAQATQNDSLRLERIRDRVCAKFAELLPEGLPEDKLAMEAAAMAVKMDVREEVDRLNAHVESARGLLDAGSPTGRKLDFLTQEFNREANTLCSKSADSSLTQTGLAMKNAIDQLREQVQNVE
jgi:uncharacterized protein (TIGR00255 family)